MMEQDSSRIFDRLIATEQLDPVRRVRDASEAESDHWSHPVVLERAAYLRKLARAGDGSASETLREYEGHSMMLSVRLRNGIAELHHDFADLFIVLDGQATLLSGGDIEGAHQVGPGEIRGRELIGAARRQLRAGDVAYVAAGTPHQMVLSGDKGFVAMVMKIKHSPQRDGSAS